MAYATLLVHVEADPTPDPRLGLAVDLANRFGAKLIGVGAELYKTAYYGGAAGYAVGEFMASEMDSVRADLARAEDKFRAAAAAVKAGLEWRAALDFPLAKIAAECRAADLVITSWSRHRSGYEAAASGPIILQAGRPVLVAAPDEIVLDASTAVVAWKDAREARRALVDALPFLKLAETVELVEIVGRKDEAPAAAARLADVAGHLLLHGVAASTSAEIEDKHATGAEQLLDFAERKNAGLIVAGGYGHTRMREWVLGGFTRALLAQSKRSVLFSH
jgi:nucleotide-binding universal stress UspA family protein